MIEPTISPIGTSAVTMAPAPSKTATAPISAQDSVQVTPPPVVNVNPPVTTITTNTPFHVSTHILGAVLLFGSTVVVGVIADPGVVNWLAQPAHFFWKAIASSVIVAIPLVANYKNPK